MAVELAVCAPVVLVVALIVYNLLCFVEACSAFDQLALDAVVAHGVSPAAEQTQASAVSEVQEALAEALGREGQCEVAVRAEPASGAGSGSGSQASFSLNPLLTRYVCTLTFHPWPSRLRMPGITLEAPLALTHERSLVVDRYRSSVI